MIISHKYKFIFIKTAKTAGTSIEVYLSQYCGSDDVFTPIWPHVEPHVPRNYRGLWNPLPELFSSQGGRGTRRTLKDFARLRKYYNHIPAKTVKQVISRHIWDSYFKFCVERNPWDKTVSHYNMVNDRADSPLTFADYMEQGKFCFNYPKYTDANGDVMVDRILEYDRLSSELSEVFEQLGVPYNGSLDIDAKSNHRKTKAPYQQQFSDEQKKIVELAFAQEIEIHGYSF